MTPNPPEMLVVFDLGHVLIDVAPNWDAACRLADLPPVGRLDEDARVAIHGAILDLELGRIDQDAFDQRVGAALRRSPDDVRAASEAFLRGPYPGVEELIADLVRLGVPLACLSNTNALHWANMLNPTHRCHLGLDRFTHRWASHLMGHRKPDPAIYAGAQREAAPDGVEFLSGDTILFFDNKPANVRAARDAGWFAEQIPEDGDPVPKLRRHLFDHGLL